MALPNFLMLGSPKCGTTACAHNLSRHPQVHVGQQYIHPLHGEEWLHFFTDEAMYARGPAWYASQILGNEPCPRCGRNVSKTILGDRHTTCLSKEECHARIKETVPNAKIIIMLRNPVTRAYSHWNHFRHTFMSSPEWRNRTFEIVVREGPKSPIVMHGYYAAHLKHLLEFFPREQVHIAITERVRADMGREYSRMFHFLGADPSLIDGRWYQDALTAREMWPYPSPMLPQTHAQLTEHYRPHNEKLFDLLDGEIPEWLVT